MAVKIGSIQERHPMASAEKVTVQWNIPKALVKWIGHEAVERELRPAAVLVEILEEARRRKRNERPQALPQESR